MALPGSGAARAWIGRQALRRGLMGSSRVWLAVFVAGRVVWVLRRVVGPRKAPVVHSERLAPDTGVEIRHMRPNRG